MVGRQVDAQLRVLEQRPGVADVVVVGGGYCGVELAASMAERLQGHGRVQLITGGAAWIHSFVCILLILCCS